METQRLRLRQWRDSDLIPFFELNSDPEVMLYFPTTLNQSETRGYIERLRSTIAENGWGFWAVESQATGEFMGFVGLNKPSADLPFNPCVEIGWRLAKRFWGYGYATEAAQAALRFGFEILSLDEVVSFTPIQNKPSQAVMKRLGMVDTGRTFIHPQVPVGHHLQEHILFTLSQEQWRRYSSYSS